MSYTDEERAVLAAEVAYARVGKHMGKEAAARAADLNSITWKKVEDAEPVRDVSLAKVLTSLGLPSAAELLEMHRVEQDADDVYIASQIRHPSRHEFVQEASSADAGAAEVLRDVIENGVNDTNRQRATRLLEELEIKTFQEQVFPDLSHDGKVDVARYGAHIHHQEGEQRNVMETATQQAASSEESEDEKTRRLRDEAKRRAAGVGDRMQAVRKGVGGQDAVDS